MADLTNTFVFDTETTGLTDNDRVLTIGGVLFSARGSEIIDRTIFNKMFNWLMLPGMEKFDIPETVIKVHGITMDKMKAEGIHPVVGFAMFCDFLVEHGAADGRLREFVAHNLPFDMNMLYQNVCFLKEKIVFGGIKYDEDVDKKDVESKVFYLFNLLSNDKAIRTESDLLFVDTVTLDRILNPLVNGKKVLRGLQVIGTRYGIEVDTNAHDALADTERLVDIYSFMMKEMENKGIAVDEDLQERLLKKCRKTSSYYNSRRKTVYNPFSPEDDTE